MKKHKNNVMKPEEYKRKKVSKRLSKKKKGNKKEKSKKGYGRSYGY